jgi:hypothetical protein
MNRITTAFFTISMMIAAIQKPTATAAVSIRRNPKFGHRFMVLHTWAKVLPSAPSVMSISTSLTMKLICGDCFLARWKSD